MNLNESIKEVFQDPEIQEAIKSQVDSIANEKANEMMKSLLDQKTKELETMCEEYKTHISENNETKITEAIDNKIDELEHHCENYKKELDAIYERRVIELTEKLSEYVDDIIEEFVQEHKEQFTINESRMKVDTILEALSAVCAIAGVRAEQITQGCKYLSEKDSIIKDQRIENLKSKIKLQEQSKIELKKKNAEIQEQSDNFQKESIRLQKELDDKEQDYVDATSEAQNEKYKNKELEEALKEYVRKSKVSESDSEQQRKKNQELKEKLSECTDTIKKLETRISEMNKTIIENENAKSQALRKMNSELDSLKKMNESLKSENIKILKMGVISEMKQGMTLTEAKRFEQIADHIPFEQTQEYFDKLEVLKNELLNNPKYKNLNEVTGNEESQESEADTSRWDHLI